MPSNKLKRTADQVDPVCDDKWCRLEKPMNIILAHTQLSIKYASNAFLVVVCVGRRPRLAAAAVHLHNLCKKICSEGLLMMAWRPQEEQHLVAKSE